MGETHHHRQQGTTSSRLGMRAAAGGGEIVEVQGGHIVRSTGRKDRHSKVCTAKGPRDRRVRLSAHTAIQFYDVQDRLGYDRPSKAVDWLIKKAKAAIDELAELPAWKPTATTATASNSNVAILQQKLQEEEEHQLNQIVHREPTVVDDAIIFSGSRRATAAPTLVGGGCGGGGGGVRISEFQPQQHLSDDNGNSKYNSGGSAFLPQTLDTDIADTIKSFFPMVAAAETTTSSFQNYPPPPDLLSRTTSGASNQSRYQHHHQQDLRLSLQSFQDPILLHHQQQHQQHQHHVHEQVLFAGTTALGFDGGSSGWSEQQHQQEEQEHGRLQRMVAWNNAAAAAAAAADAGSSGHGGGFIFNSPAAAAVPSPAVFGHGQFFTQRGPLQSSNTPTIRAWIDPSSFALAAGAVDHHHHLHHYLSPAAIHQASVGFAGSSSGGFSGFRVPARIQGEEEHDGVYDKPSSAASDSRH